MGVNHQTCVKNLASPTIIDHILTNHPKRFQSFPVYEKGLSDLYKLTLIVEKAFHVSHKHKFVQYQDFNYFNNALFRVGLVQEQTFFKMKNLRNPSMFSQTVQWSGGVL